MPKPIQYFYSCFSVLLRKKTNIDLMATDFQNLVGASCFLPLSTD